MDPLRELQVEDDGSEPGLLSSVEETILAEIDIGSARGGRKPQREADIAVVRSLTVDDLASLGESPDEKTLPSGQLQRLGYRHHQIAQLIARGMEEGEVSLITGYSPSYLSVLKSKSDFRSLVEYYHLQREQVFVDVLERMKDLGLQTLDELQGRLDAEPEKWTKRELMDMAKLLLVDSGASGGGFHGSSGGAPQVAVNVSFVRAAHPGSATVIDVEAD